VINGNVRGSYLIHWLIWRAALLLAVSASFAVAPAWLCLLVWYGLAVVVGSVLFFRRVREWAPFDAIEQGAEDRGGDADYGTDDNLVDLARPSG